MKKDDYNDIAGTLQEMRDEYRRGIEKSEETAGAETRLYVVVRFGGKRFGLPSHLTQEVVRIPRLVRIPRVATHILGVINLRGEIVAATDLRPLFGLPVRELSSDGRLVVTECNGLTTALAVEEVEGLHPVPDRAIEPPTGELPAPLREVASGQLIDEKGLLLLLDLPRILDRHEFVIEQNGV